MSNIFHKTSFGFMTTRKYLLNEFNYALELNFIWKVINADKHVFEHLRILIFNYLESNQRNYTDMHVLQSYNTC